MTSPSRPPPALRTHALSKAFGAVSALRGVSLTVEAGQTVALLGPSGCGKSTALRCVAGLERPDGGRVEIAGRDVSDLPPEARHLGLVFQDYALFPHLSVLGNAAYGPQRRGASRSEAQARAREALELVGLGALAGRRPDQLSGGQQQRVALARALATRSPLLLLDEPLSNLDEKLRAELRAELRRLFAGLGAGVLLVTHDQREAAALADRVAVMRAGRVVQEGSARDVFARPASAWVAAFLRWPNIVAQPGGTALLIPGAAARLGVGEAYPLHARQPGESGEAVTVRHPLGLLTFQLSEREVLALKPGAGLDDTLRLTLDLERAQRVPDDREDAG